MKIKYFFVLLTLLIAVETASVYRSYGYEYDDDDVTSYPFLNIKLLTI